MFNAQSINLNEDANASFKSHIKNTKIETKLIKITPDIAKKYLERNTENRKLRPSWVTTLAQAIKNNEFITTHQSIAFSKSGRLLDGQHRLHAIVLANKPVDMFVTANLDEDAFHAIDCGIKRNIGDLTGLQPKTAELCRLFAYLIFRTGKGKATAAHALKIANTGIGDLSNELLSYCGTTRKIVSSSSVRGAAIIHILNGESKDIIFKNYANLCMLNFDKLPPVYLSFLKQINTTNINANDINYYLTRSLKMFNPIYKNVTTLRTSDNETNLLMDFARETLKTYVGEYE
jgi:hypothetical protein